ncbi:hypothetical protein CGRA01v4_07274 [Colletotrichum graminicola]|nr:hypothetical protein CGRA01v4_07274 [Colletotrichum graminicola]
MCNTAHHHPHNPHPSVCLVVLLSEKPAYPNPDLPVLSSSLASCTAASDPRSVLLSALLILLAQFDSPVLPGSSFSALHWSPEQSHKPFFPASAFSPSKHLSFLAPLQPLSSQVDPTSRNGLPKQLSRLLSWCQLTSQETPGSEAIGESGCLDTVPDQLRGYSMR